MNPAIEFYDKDEKTWKLSRFGWLPDDIAWLNDVVGWPMYREKETA